MHDKNDNDSYRTIDGNYARAVIGYCQYHRGYITSKQARTHRCHLKHGGVCPRLQDMEKRCIRKMKTEVFYDKMLDRMDKMITAMNKLTRTLEAIQKNGAETTTLEEALREARSMTAEEFLFGKADE